MAGFETESPPAIEETEVAPRGRSSSGSDFSLQNRQKASFTPQYLVGAWVQHPGSCTNPDDQTVIMRDGMAEDALPGTR